MPNTKDIDLWGAFKILLVAPNGRGKSIAAASFYKAGPIHFCDFDGRMKPVKYVYPDADISYTSYGVDDFRSFMHWTEDLQRNPPKFKTIVIDSLTSLSMTSVMYQLLVKGNKKIDPKTGIPATTWDEINRETVMISTALEILKVMYENHGINIIMTAHPVVKTEIAAKEGESKKSESLIAYGNKIGGIAPGYFDEIYRITVKKVDLNGQLRRFAITNLTSVDDDILAKSALPIPQEIDITDGLYDKLISFKK